MNLNAIMSMFPIELLVIYLRKICDLDIVNILLILPLFIDYIYVEWIGLM